MDITTVSQVYGRPFKGLVKVLCVWSVGRSQFDLMIVIIYV